MPATSTRIQVLPNTLANQIAAGEVIERPASVVKELVENSLDAGATSIRISVTDSGLTRLEVLDNGHGIPRGELALAIQRHATSKIVTTHDLFNINTFGFRGEALPSITSVARLTLTSRVRPERAASAADADTAWQLAPDAHGQGEVKPAALPPGTRVLVEDLFYATPARRKFLKGARAERAALEDVILRLALAHPHAAFTLVEDGAETWHIPAAQEDFFTTITPRLATLLGEPFAQHALPVFAARAGDENDDGRPHAMSEKAVHGFISHPTHHAGNNRQQFFFVNGRAVRDRALQAAVRQAYTDLIPATRHPLFTLFLSLPPSEVDVNVHPAKAEVRFRDANGLFGFIYAAVRQTLASLNHGSSHASAPYASAEPLPAMPLPVQLSAPLPAAPQQLRKGSETPAPPYPSSGLAEPTPWQLSTPASFDPATADAQPATNQDEPAVHPLGAAIGQIDTTYVLAEGDDGTLVLVDQHAAHERIVYEQLKAQYAAGGIATQPLLLPATVSLTPSAVQTLLHHADALRAFGLELEQFSPSAVSVMALPQLLGDTNPVTLVQDLLGDLQGDGPAQRHSLHSRLDHVLATLACHHSIRAHRRLSLPEMNSLLRQMERNPNTLTCNHGRPTVVRFTRAQLETLFAR